MSNPTQGAGTLRYGAQDHGINSEVSTILMVSNEKFLHLNSSIIRELAEYNTDLSKFVPKNVEERLMKKLKGL